MTTKDFIPPSDYLWDAICVAMGDQIDQCSNPKKTWNSILYVVATGCRWRDIPHAPERFCSDSTAHKWAQIWSKSGAIDRVRETIKTMTPDLPSDKELIHSIIQNSLPAQPAWAKNRANAGRKAIEVHDRELKMFLEKYTDDVCRNHIIQLRFGDLKACPICAYRGKFYPINRLRLLYRCAYCRSDIHLLAGTIFSRSSIRLSTWFCVIFLCIKYRDSVSIIHIKKTLGINYGAAKRMLNIIRPAIRGNYCSLFADRDQLLGINFAE